MSIPDQSLAVLIDADNTNAGIVEGLLSEVATLGVASVKRIYGDWTSPQLAKWKAMLLAHSLQPIQQFAYTTGKNATDSAMIIDAMDLLHTGEFDGFCLVSSDSDFTRLAARLRESGKVVYGFGQKKTPESLRAACDRFIFTENLREPDQVEAQPTSRAKSGKDLRGDAKLVNLIRAAVESASNDDGWANLGAVGSTITKQAPDFDPRTYGYARLSVLVEKVGLFAIARDGQQVLINNDKAATR